MEAARGVLVRYASTDLKLGNLSVEVPSLFQGWALLADQDARGDPVNR